MNHTIQTTSPPLPAAITGALAAPAQCRRLVASTHAALRASRLNARPFKLAALIVEASLARGRQFIYVLNARQLGELYAFSGSDIAAILNGYEKNGHVMGLIEAKIVRWVDLPSNKGWLLVFNPDWSHWDVPMMHLPADKSKWLGVVDAQARELERQMVADEIEWQFPDMAALLSAEDVKNALRLIEDGKSYVVAASSSTGVDAPVDRAQTKQPGGARPSCAQPLAGDRKDAPQVLKQNHAAARIAASSEIPKHKPPEKPPQFGNSEASCARPVKQGVEQTTVQQFNSSVRRDNSNQLLADLKAQFVRAHGQVEADAEMVQSGGFWRRVARAWPSLMEREIGALRNHISEGGGFSPKAWFYISFYMLQSLGEPNWTIALKKVGTLPLHKP